MLYIPDLFIQSSNLCAGTCRNCYVKARKYNGQISVQILQDLLEKLAEAKKVCASNITFSYDKPGHGAEKYNDVMTIFSHKKQDQVGLHLTANHLLDIIKVHNSKFDSISLSNLPYKDVLEKDYKTKFIYNYLVPREYNPVTVNIPPEIDKVYCILTKFPMDKPLFDQQIEGYKRTIENYFLYWDDISKQLPPNKCIMDRCITESILALMTGYTCSANSSLLQVWPDGSVSGCPYAYKSTGNLPVKSADDIIQNMKIAKKSCEFNDCLLAKLVQEYYIKRTHDRQTNT